MMSSPDLCLTTSSRRNSPSRRCRLSIASSSVKRLRMPRNSETSPSPGLRSTMMVGRLLSRASSTALLTASVVVPEPPLAPKNTSVVAWRAPDADCRRAAARASASENAACTGGHVRNSFAPARIACRMTSGCASSATTKMAIDGEAKRSRSTAAIARATSVRASTITRSACEPSRENGSPPRLTGVDPVRSTPAMSFLHLSSSVRIDATRRAMCYSTSLIACGNTPAGAGPALGSITPRIGVIRPNTLLPSIRSTKNPSQLATRRSALRPLAFPHA